MYNIPCIIKDNRGGYYPAIVIKNFEGITQLAQVINEDLYRWMNKGKTLGLKQLISLSKVDSKKYEFVMVTDKFFKMDSLSTEEELIVKNMSGGISDKDEIKNRYYEMMMRNNKDLVFIKLVDVKDNRGEGVQSIADEMSYICDQLEFKK